MKSANQNAFDDIASQFGPLPITRGKTSDLKADWLLSDFQSNTWTVARGADKSKTKSFYWDVPLYNGERLGEKKYADLLTLTKKIVFSCRSGALGTHSGSTETTRTKHQYSIYSSLLVLIRRLVMQGCEPDRTGFKTIDPEFLRELAKSALRGRPFSDGTYEAIKELLECAKANNCLHSFIHQGTGELDFGSIFRELGEPSSNGSFSVRLRAALNDYESCSMPKHIDQKYSAGREYPSTRSTRTEELLETPVSVSTLMGIFSSLRTLGILAENWQELNGLEWCRSFNVTELAYDLGFTPKNRTPTIPVDIALHYLDSAIFWVVEIGPELLELKKKYDKRLRHVMSKVTKKKDEAARTIQIDLPIELKEKLATRNIDIVRYNRYSSGTTHRKIREDMTLEDAVSCLIAAAFILVSTFSCKRISEVLALSEEAIRPSLDGGWELVFGLKKSSPSENLRKVGRPVPDIVEKACGLLVDLYPACIDLPESTSSKPIFLNDYAESLKSRAPRFASEHTMYHHLELYADVEQIPLNDRGERWYLRSHELRRFFAITYFWHDRFAGLSALSWLMGHSSTEETMRYVVEEIAGAELPEEEARLTASALTDTTNSFPIDGLEVLAEDAKEYFKVDDLRVINIDILESYLENRYQEGYRIVKHGYKHAKVVYLEEHND
ncbi:site-specific integrase [Congregibacter litoralis]|uniref:Phage integrase family n=1 Tax=Congregibacter litoralis KT71 TaxID=314285 RepID=A4AAD9_9GAMM|nr:site-specific integrase [Congregibacter litoralis]EAQ97016.2 hypothetical protein KT71_12175 [Congregibacter litoralis KT71]